MFIGNAVKPKERDKKMSDSNLTNESINTTVTETVTETVNNQQKGNETMSNENTVTTTEASATLTPAAAILVPAKKVKKGPPTIMEQLTAKDAQFSAIQLSRWFESPTADFAVKAHIIAMPNCPVEIFESALNMRTSKKDAPDQEWVERKVSLFEVMASCGGAAQTDFLLKVGAIKGLNRTGQSLLVTHGSAQTVIAIVSNPTFDLEQLPMLFENNAWSGDEAAVLADKVSEAINNVIFNDLVKIGKVYALICSPVIADLAKTNEVIKNLLRGLLNTTQQVNAKLRQELLGEAQ